MYIFVIGTFRHVLVLQVLTCKLHTHSSVPLCELVLRGDCLLVTYTQTCSIEDIAQAAFRMVRMTLLCMLYASQLTLLLC